MGGDKKAKIMGQTTKKKIREGPSVVWLLTPREKEEKSGQQFQIFSTILFRFKAGVDKRPDAGDLVLSVST